MFLGQVILILQSKKPTVIAQGGFGGDVLTRPTQKAHCDYSERAIWEACVTPPLKKPAVIAHGRARV